MKDNNYNLVERFSRPGVEVTQINNEIREIMVNHGLSEAEKIGLACSVIIHETQKAIDKGNDVETLKRAQKINEAMTEKLKKRIAQLEAKLKIYEKRDAAEIEINAEIIPAEEAPRKRPRRSRRALLLR